MSIVGLTTTVNLSGGQVTRPSDEVRMEKPRIDFMEN